MLSGEAVTQSVEIVVQRGVPGEATLGFGIPVRHEYPY